MVERDQQSLQALIASYTLLFNFLLNEEHLTADFSGLDYFTLTFQTTDSNLDYFGWLDYKNI